MAKSTSKPLITAAPEVQWQAVQAEAAALGFDASGVAPAAGTAAMRTRLQAFLDAGYHGSMAWLADRQHHREAPTGLWADAKSVIMLTCNYGPDTNPLDALTHKSSGTISVYAQNLDYHDVLKKRVKALGRWLAEATDCQLKVFVDTAPVMEKPLAALAGLGWQGKHTNLVTRSHGSWTFLAAIMTTLDLPLATPHQDQCGSCRACLDACPTNAFPAPYRLDARRCISYLTIEHKGPVDEDLRPKLGNRIYGCDDCLSVCPWNKFASHARDIGFHARTELQSPPLKDLLLLDDPAFRALFRKNPVKRIGRDRFVRNALYAAGNSGDPNLIPYAKQLCSDPDPVVADAARWAVNRLQIAVSVNPSTSSG